MISRSTLVAALVVVELAIAGAAVRSLTGDSDRQPARDLAASGAAGSGEAASPYRRFATGSAPHVVVDVKDVRVVIAAAAAEQVEVSESVRTFGWVSGSVPHVAVEQTADGVRITSRSGSGMHIVMGSIEHVVRVTVPAAAAVEVRSSGRIEASGLRARLSAHSEDGSVHVRDLQGDIDVSTDDGSVELADVRAGTVSAHTADGRLTLARVVAERLNAATDDGRVEATDVRLGEGAITTKDGRVRVAYAPDSDTVLTARTGDGTIELPPGAAQLAAVAADRDDDSDHRERVVRLGSGRGSFEISSGDGSISIMPGARV